MSTFNVDASTDWLCSETLLTTYTSGRGRSKPVIKLDAADKQIGSYPSIVEAAKAVNVGPGSIRKVLKGSRNLAGGYGWRYQR